MKNLESIRQRIKIWVKMVLYASKIYFCDIIKIGLHLRIMGREGKNPGRGGKGKNPVMEDQLANREEMIEKEMENL